MPSVLQSSPFGAILLAAQAQLVAFGVVPKDRCFIVGRDPKKVEHWQALADVLIRPGGFTPDQGRVGGGGRLDSGVHREMLVYVRQRLDRDQADQDIHWLTDSDGFLALEEAVVNYLQIIIPADVAGNLLLIEPMRVMGSSPPDKDNNDGDSWGFSTLRFDCFYYTPIDLNPMVN
jgi:hypothetical protein